MSQSHDPRPRVLIVDDEENILAALRRLLRREPYELISATSAQEALRMMQSEPAQLVITDYRMPGMTGTELLHEIQRHWPETIRIVLSGYSEVKAIISAINEGAVYKFFAKPWNDEEVKLHVRRALEQFALQADNKRMTREISQQNEQLRKLNQLLDQRATDAGIGQTCAQEFLETIDAGVLTIDSGGLIVGANLRSAELLSKEQAGFIGVAAKSALPEPLHNMLHRAGAFNAGGACGRIEHGERNLQWRTRALEINGECRGTVITIWEEVACQLT
ncbi:MAG: response regulator [Phycisphaerae bacterium]|nr:response regulator [Phycisphaerae bacterium]